MYSVFQWFGTNTEIQAVVKPEYLSVAEGSTLTDLTRLATDQGIHATAVGNLSRGSLESSPYPIVCSVRKYAGEEPFNHYVVVFPTATGERVAYDALDNTTVPLSAVVDGRWNGYGLVLSQEPIQLWRVFWRDYLFLVLAVPLLLLVRWLVGRRRKMPQAAVRAFSSCATGALALVLFATCASLAAQASGGGLSLLASGKSVQAIQERHFEMFLPKLSAEGVEKSVAGNSVIIDARRVEDYALGHIERAINVSPWSGAADYDKVLADVPKDREIVLYCQSAGCPYAGQVGKELWRRGYTNLAYYKPGWVEWQERLENKAGGQS